MHFQIASLPSQVVTITALLASLSTLALCEPPLGNQYGVPGNFAGPQGGGGGAHGGISSGYGAPFNGGHNHVDQDQDYVDNTPKSYEFGYAVKDAATGNDFGRRESSDGETVRGEYRVQLPDGRTQIVTYTADWRTGFHADVRYEGVASYPDQYNTGNNGFNNQGYDYPSNNLDSGYNAGNNPGHNDYRGGSPNFNSGSNYNYQFGGNSIDNTHHNHNYNHNNHGNNFASGYNNNNPFPSSTYGPPGFH